MPSSTLDTADAALLAEFNDAADAFAILAAIDAHAAALLEGDSATHFAELPDNAGRQQAIGLGLKEIADLFGDFTSVAQLKLALEHQIAVEYAKHQFIGAMDAATTAEEMAAAITAHVDVLNGHRQELIAEWGAVAGNAAVAARVAELQAEDYTTVLNDVAARLGDSGFVADLGTSLLDARNALPGGKFFGVVKIITALDNANDAPDAALLAAFNDAADATEVLDAIDTYDASLLEGDSATHFRALPDNAGRQQAIALGVKEIADLFGDFTSVAQLKAALEHQIAVEYAKHQFIGAIDSATTADEMAAAISDYAGTLNADRQALIAEWGAVGGNPAVAARVAALRADDYTKVLAEITAHLGDGPFLADLAAGVLAVRNEMPNDKFFGVVKIIAALDAASNDAPTDISLSNATLAENAVAGTVIGSLAALDDDLGDTFSFKLLDDAGGRFAVQGGKLVVANGTLLDYEQATSHKIVVKVTDSIGASVTKTLTLSLSDVLNESAVGSSGSDNLSGGTGNDNLAGDAGDDVLSAGAGNDKVDGGTGNDKLWGGLGKDTLAGGIGKDIFVFNTKPNKKTNLDKITDFNVKDDTIWLENAVFMKLGRKGSETSPAKLNKKFFSIDSAKDRDDYIVYNKKTGVVSYDLDGSGAKKAVEIATLKKNLKLTYNDFLVI